ncbi:cytotoxic granule associated RNA binding protein TIA1-like [Paramacrobiotus metropolitanus]|uniref:cytotoxic granule associated RNA binding protein TIA1-like n=1 Tax=Paramacrobiotus metropolitanus TaxID=2943436 RepID=UPI002445C6B0|nr:cytotoxic granule associated RNA binding protein TIA1-like [Paramacrobiotus metropolitanus]
MVYGSSFAAFGSVLDCRVIRDPLTHKSKCFGFVRFAKNEEAEIAIAQSSSMFIDGRKVRTNWAVKRDPDYPLSLEQVLVQASPYNTTIYIGGLGRNFNAEFVRGMCAMYGPLMELRLFQDKGYAFVRYATRESAAGAILGINNSEINGYHVRCSWGKEMRDPYILKMARTMPTLMDGGYTPCTLPSHITAAFPPAPPLWPLIPAAPQPPTQIATNIGNYHISFPYATPPFYQTIQF